MGLKFLKYVRSKVALILKYQGNNVQQFLLRTQKKLTWICRKYLVLSDKNCVPLYADNRSRSQKDCIIFKIRRLEGAFMFTYIWNKVR